MAVDYTAYNPHSVLVLLVEQTHTQHGKVVALLMLNADNQPFQSRWLGFVFAQHL